MEQKKAADEFAEVEVLLAEKDHAHPGDGGWRRVRQIDRLEDEVDVGSELDPLAVRQRQQPVIVEHRVQRLDPLRVHVAVADDPRIP